MWKGLRVVTLRLLLSACFIILKVVLILHMC